MFTSLGLLVHGQPYEKSPASSSLGLGFERKCNRVKGFHGPYDLKTRGVREPPTRETPPGLLLAKGGQKCRCSGARGGPRLCSIIVGARGRDAVVGGAGGPAKCACHIHGPTTILLIARRRLTCIAPRWFYLFDLTVSQRGAEV